MADSHHDPMRRAGRQGSLHRDAALGRVGSLTKGVGMATVAAVAAFGIYVSRALPGHSTAPAGASTANQSPGGSSSTQPSSGAVPGGGSSSNLAPPSAPPAPTQRPAPVVSGAS